MNGTWGIDSRALIPLRCSESYEERAYRARLAAKNKQRCESLYRESRREFPQQEQGGIEG